MKYLCLILLGILAYTGLHKSKPVQPSVINYNAFTNYLQMSDNPGGPWTNVMETWKVVPTDSEKSFFRGKIVTSPGVFHP